MEREKRERKGRINTYKAILWKIIIINQKFKKLLRKGLHVT